MRWIPRTAASLAALTALVAATGCQGGDRGPRYRPAGNTSPHRGGTLTYSTRNQVRTLDPAIGFDEVSSYPLHDLFDTLVGYEPADPKKPGSGLRLVPHLAASWTVSDDHLDYQFTLRPNLRYSNGQPVVAGDFKYGLERVLSDPASPFGSFLDDVEGAPELTAGKAKACTGIRVIDDTHLEIRLSRPYAAFLYVLAMSFATPERADHVAAVGDQIRAEPLGTGPWRLVRWDEGQKLVLERNPNYWEQGIPYLDRLILLENIPSDTAFLMFQEGELETVDRLPPPDYVWIQTQAAWKPYVHDSMAMNSYGERMNVTVKPFDDVRVRRAMNYAVNKEHIIKLLNGGASISHGVLPPGMFGRDASIQPYPHDPAKARELLAEAGYPDGFDVDYVTLNIPSSVTLAESLQADLAEVGVRVHIKQMTFATYLTAIGKPDGPAFSYGAWVQDFPDPSDFVDTKFDSKMISKENSNNDSFYSNPKLDALIRTARFETDEVKRADEYHRIERILYDDAPWIWEYHRHFLEVSQPYVANYAPHPVWTRDYTYTWLDVRPDGSRVPAGGAP